MHALFQTQYYTLWKQVSLFYLHFGTLLHGGDLKLGRRDFLIGITCFVSHFLWNFHGSFNSHVVENMWLESVNITY